MTRHSSARLYHRTSIPLAISLALIAILASFAIHRSSLLPNLLKTTRLSSIQQHLRTPYTTATTRMASQSTSGAESGAGLQLRARPSDERGHADHDWLRTYHTFSFAMYQDPKYQQYGSLRVINEDRVARGYGFDAHPHREFEIFSYVVNGTLEHNDSMGNTEVLKRGDVQMTSAGTGIRHSEHNRKGKQDVHFLQIWARPNQSGLQPKYYTRHFTDAEKLDRLVKIVAPMEDADVKDEREASGPAPVHGNVTTYASILSPSKSLTHTLLPTTKRALVHSIMTTGYRDPGEAKLRGSTKLQVTPVGQEGEGLALDEGDGAFIEVKGDGRTLKLENVEGESGAELLLFEMSD